MFIDRSDAGRRLAVRLRHLRDADPVVLGLPRGGVPVAFEVAGRLGAPLDVIVVRKLGVPVQPELGFGAIGEDGVRIVNHDVVRMAGLYPEQMEAVEEHERAVLAERARRLRAGRPRVPLTGRTAIVVDDGIATGSTARAACHVARAHGAARVVLATPVCSPEVAARLGDAADEVVCLHTPRTLYAIGQWYDDFSQTGDAEVTELLNRAGAGEHSAAGGHSGAGENGGAGERGRAEEVRIPAGSVELPGTLTLPGRAAGLVVFAHGSGSGRHSPRNRAVAEALNRAGLGTLLFDLLVAEEEADRSNVFDIPLLGGRLGEVTGWLHKQVPGTGIGCFGASTGAAAALWAAADAGADVAAVVSRGGRPDLAGPRLTAVRAPTLLIVGGLDGQVLELNRQARSRLRCESHLEVVPGATHLFEEPGTLEQVAVLACDWFIRHLAGPAGGPARPSAMEPD
ncbi:phosphoribosyltransferase family protein [Planobispora siamensis]|uniref:Putative phosphoribosyl transferase n=1 Tax=Planobispora siamensis TaxID=936338 RepID=A0A8J3SI40_9ACTN|nr:phosphoribosyltransferase [Planobispora siamensis]GIH93390.1 putative phosphoribosyl transferase [Planobispora siamensis]